MSYDATITLCCDCEGCDETFTSDLRIGATRNAACRDGWQYEQGGHDYCPTHSVDHRGERP